VKGGRRGGGDWGDREEEREGGSFHASQFSHLLTPRERRLPAGWRGGILPPTGTVAELSWGSHLEP